MIFCKCYWIEISSNQADTFICCLVT